MQEYDNLRPPYFTHKLGPVAKFWCSACLGGPGLARQFLTMQCRHSRRMNSIHLKSMCMTCVKYLWILITSIHTSRFGLDKVDLADIVIHKLYQLMEFTFSYDFACKIPRLAPTQAGWTLEFGYRPLACMFMISVYIVKVINTFCV